MRLLGIMLYKSVVTLVKRVIGIVRAALVHHARYKSEGERRVYAVTAAVSEAQHPMQATAHVFGYSFCHIGRNYCFFQKIVAYFFDCNLFYDSPLAELIHYVSCTISANSQSAKTTYRTNFYGLSGEFLRTIGRVFTGTNYRFYTL